MKTGKRVVFLVLIVFACAVDGFAEERALTVKECYALALARSESIGIQKGLIRETEGVMMQSLSTALPKLAFAYSEKWQDLVPNNRWGGSVPEGRFTFTQPLFTGFKEFAAISASKHVGKQRAAELERAQQLLLLDVSDAFYLYLGYQQDLMVQKDVRQILSDRVDELKKRESLGKSRSSEVASAEARLLRIEAGIEVAQGQMESAGQLLEFLIGRSVGELQGDPLPRTMDGLDVLAEKVNKRPDVIAAQEALESVKKNVIAVKSLFLPTVGLTGNTYTKRTGTNEGNNWDATVSVNVPLFNGLSDVGQLVQARAQVNEADLRLSQVRRKALLEIRNAYIKQVSSCKKLDALLKAVVASDRNYQLQAEDFRKSLVNNLDVLQALEDLQSIRQESVSARVDANRAFWLLKVVTGENVQ